VGSLGTGLDRKRGLVESFPWRRAEFKFGHIEEW
jgi:hypothetical protein